MTTVSAVVASLDGESYLAGCLESIAAQTLRPADVVVVDGGSRDDSALVAESRGARFVVTANRGLGALYNHGAAVTSGEYILFSNHDVAFEASCVERLADVLDGDARRFAADPTQLDWDGRRVIHARTSLTRGRLLREHLPGLHLDDTVPATSVVPTVSAHGGAMLVRRTMFEALGGFDETFFLEWEDLDLCWRAWLHGWESHYVPAARLRHRVGGATTQAVLPRRAASSHHNLVRFALKCLPLRPALVVVAGELLRAARHPRAVTTGLARVVSELPSILAERRRLRPHARVYGRLVGRR